ncbi:cell division ATP-binding protein FtsE [Bifidobacterium vansinderenii]|uniref:Cell division ATP-binding protein FtsE n=1 Tax=Bifidobacterium vansinderenii TaxID=1984871 RepID=A0A229W0M0_9BIFI|nr:cell division ATP-binding protein FtsE [Bifidobacterium vansinderenii]OXN01366.1 cell division protein FtsE [Bifidobacterium vansinderenii]
MALISLKDVTKIYPRGSRPALDDITLDIDRGEFVFLVGASGSGKTTLLSLLLHEELATEGDIRVAGNDLRRMRNRQVPQYRRSIGFVFQDYKLLANKTVYQNVAFALEVIGTRRSTIKSLVPQVLQTVGLTGKEDRLPHELSGGEAQRVAIARAYVNHPQILLADEPTGNLDPTTSVGIMEVLEAINRTGTTIVMATHNEEIVNSMRKRVVELHNGKIVRDEAQGSYDSATYFPDAEVEAKAQKALGVDGRTQLRARAEGTTDAEDSQSKSAAKSVDRLDDKTRSVTEGVLAAAEAVNNVTAGDEGIARLANSVHSGRTGRYGEAFAPVETTLTWGRGIVIDDSTVINDDGNTTNAPAIDDNTDDRAENVPAASAPAQPDNDPDAKFKPRRAPAPPAAPKPSQSASSKPKANGTKKKSAPKPPTPPAPPAPPRGRRGNGNQNHTNDQQESTR